MEIYKTKFIPKPVQIFSCNPLFPPNSVKNSISWNPLNTSILCFSFKNNGYPHISLIFPSPLTFNQSTVRRRSSPKSCCRFESLIIHVSHCYSLLFTVIRLNPSLSWLKNNQVLWWFKTIFTWIEEILIILS